MLWLPIAVPALGDAAEQVRVRLGVPADAEEGGPHVEPVQLVQHRSVLPGIGPSSKVRATAAPGPVVRAPVAR
jgi:hypothetical protein